MFSPSNLANAIETDYPRKPAPRRAKRLPKVAIALVSAAAAVAVLALIVG